MRWGLSAEDAINNLHDNLNKGVLNEDYHWTLHWQRTPWLEGFNSEGREYKFDDEDQLYDDLMAFIHSKMNQQR